MKFDQECQQRVKRIETILGEFIPKEDGYQKIIMEAMNYSLLAGGKRIRPMLMEETFQLFCGQNRAVLEPFMAAIEMIHTYSLVHDDLPAMDNDAYRRGRKTTHVVYGEAMGILAGDGLLNYAFETATQAFHEIKKTTLDTEELKNYKRVSKAIEILSSKAGIYGMIGGQVIDVQECSENFDRNRLDSMYRLKTSALIEAAMMIGAVLAGADENEMEKIKDIAGDIGLAFQIKDDILDITSSAKILGKPVHSDERNEKTTYVTLMNVEQANAEVKLISERAMKEFATLPYKNEYLEILIMNLITRNS